MSREIKFRGYCDRDTEWRYGFYVTDNKVHEIHTLLNHGEMYASQIDIGSLGQYTGLKDKNGVEIYEGDIVTNHDRQNSHCLSGTHEVYFKNGGAFPFCINGWDGSMDNDYCEVIGNIHQNPYLLKD